MSKYGVVAVGGNRTHQEGYAREFAADPRCDLIAVADEPGLPEYREGLNRLLASELGVPYLALDDALAQATGTPYGLAGYAITRDVGNAVRVAEELEFGIVGVNDLVPAVAQAPFGGMKQSGFGREGGQEGLQEYLETRFVSLAF